MIQKLLDEVYKIEQEQSTETAHKSTGWRSSSLGSCMRGQFLARLLSGDFKVQHDRRTLDVFELGNIIEDIKIAKLKKHPDYLVICQGEMAEPTLNLTGHFDALIINRKTHEPFMFESKSKSSRAFTYMDKKGQGAMGHHLLQLSSYIDMTNQYGFALADKDMVHGEEVFEYLKANADIVGTKERADGKGVKPIFKLKKKINEGSILYISKDDQRLLEYPVLASNMSLISKWRDELRLLNDAWESHNPLPMYQKTDWQTKYCNYCQAGLCEKLDSKEVVDALFEVVANGGEIPVPSPTIDEEERGVEF